MASGDNEVVKEVDDYSGLYKSAVLSVFTTYTAPSTFRHRQKIQLPMLSPKTFHADEESRYSDILLIWTAIAPPSKAGLHSPMINPLAEKSPCLCGLGCYRLLLCIAEKDE
ncbi:hypothetical protein RND71_024598 [Anisodus tanguticus]|uniref:Uncharacterized protein n=1 Tax=Anisodus tanguticus TaxID=243964 RepID=A0AAE1V538_9SOLA|nr:hypothetical protein RND71_024598 [Anisodus tanguticus]